MNPSVLKGDFPGMRTLVNEVLVPVLHLSDYDMGDRVDVCATYPEKAKAAHIQEAYRYSQQIWLGTYSLELYEIILEDNCRIQQARVNIQSIVRSEMQIYSNALMVFRYANPEGKTWRLSYACKDNNQTGMTPARRYTYLLGHDYTSNTLIKRLQTLQDTAIIDEKTLLSAFSVEALSDEFFDEYKVFYEDIVQYISGTRFVETTKNKYERRDGFLHDATIFASFLQLAKNDQAAAEKLVRDYVKKFLGRLVFLQFLQKKGWMGASASCSDWQDGDVHFMHQLFLKATQVQQNDYINRILNPLFFRCLNEQRPNDTFDTQVCSYGNDKGVVRIPYLNGGLFEQDPNSDIAVPLPAYFFSNEAQQDIARTFSKTTDKAHYPYDHACGLFDFFDRYNFTIDENDPDDAEVGVDPEMLGKIFENLLEDNKDKGAYYTPKEIVRYMCEESLIAYLETECPAADKADLRSFITLFAVPDNWLSDAAAPVLNDTARSVMTALREVKICDPAIGSGAFPMGLLNILYRCGKAMDEYYQDGTIHEDASAKIKRHIIQNNIYGVDIEKGAVDIARLRFWLALIVDEQSPEALPNLDYKIMQGNSLLESYNGIDLSNLFPDKTAQQGSVQISMFEDELDLDRRQLQRLLSLYYDTCNHTRKAEIRKQIKENIITQLQRQHYNPVNFANIDIAANNQFFLWHTWFSDVFNRSSKQGFDIVIGNPPYIKEYTNRYAFDGFREHSPYYMGKMDLWYGFACNGIDLLGSNGVLCFIAQNNWTTSTGAKKMRNKVICDSQILQMLDFNTYMVFESADIQTMVMLFRKNCNIDNYSFDYRIITEGNEKEDMLALLAKRQTNHTKYLSPIIIRAEYNNELLTFSDDERIFNKIKQNKAYLNDDEVAQGIVPNPDVVNSRNIRCLSDNNIQIGEGVFVVDKDKFCNLTYTENKYVKPLFEPYQLQRYYLPCKNEKCILYITKLNWKNDAPRLLSHLSKYKQIMQKRRENELGRIDYMHLHWARDERFFKEGAKILSVRKCVSTPIFTYYDKEAYVMMSINVIISTRWNMKFLTGLLNSTLVAFWLRHKGKMQGNNYQVDKEPLQNIPLPIVEIFQQQPIINLVDQILTAKKANPQANTTELENQIDEIVYKLYNLTPDEIAIIKGSL